MQKTALIILFFMSAFTNGAVNSSKATDVELNKSDIERARTFKLTNEEFKRFQKILKGPRSYYTPNIASNPVFALLLEAKTSKERQKYAELMVQLDFENTTKIIAAQLAYDAAKKRLYADVPMFTYGKPGTEGFSVKESLSGENVQRLKLYVAIDCEPCLEAVKDSLVELSKNRFEGVDLYFANLDSRSEDSVKNLIAPWLASSGISAQQLQAKKVTVNLGTTTHPLPHSVVY